MKLKYVVFASVLSFTTMSCAESNELFAPEPVLPQQTVDTGSTDDSSEDEGMSIIIESTTPATGPVALHEGK